MGDNSWALDIGTDLTPEALDQYLNLWPTVSAIRLDDENSDSMY